MDEISKSVAENIKTGQYYSDARKWYTHKYLYPISERSLLVLVFSITSIAFLVVLYNFNAIFPLKKEVPFVVKVEDSVDYYSIIKPLLVGDESPAEALTKYLIETYIDAYESYNFKTIAKREARIRSSSSKRVFKSYSNFMNTTNPESPLLLYQKTSMRTVRILSTTLSHDDSEVSKAVVRFETILDDRLQKKKTVNTQRADITFTMSNIDNVAAKKEPLAFIVTDYQVRQIK